MASGRGGYREKAGRKSTWNHQETTLIRVPKALIPQIMEAARKIDAGEDLLREQLSPDRLRKVMDEVMSDPQVTRSGKDKGAVRRTIDALLQKLGLSHSK